MEHEGNDIINFNYTVPNVATEKERKINKEQQKSTRSYCSGTT